MLLFLQSVEKKRDSQLVWFPLLSAVRAFQCYVITNALLQDVTTPVFSVKKIVIYLFLYILHLVLGSVVQSQICLYFYRPVFYCIPAITKFLLCLNG